jgi:signal transduction histidine kinase
MRKSEHESAPEPVAAPATPGGGEEVSPSALLVLAAHELLYRLGRPNLLREACRITCDVLDADLVVALARAEGGRSLVTMALHGLGEEERALYQMIETIEFDEAISDAIRQRLTAVEVSILDVSESHPSAEDESRRWIARKLGLGPMLLMALRPGGELSGVLIVCRRASKGGFDGRALKVATGLVPLLGASLENQRLFDDLEAASRAQSDFLASMSHELRTPLHVIVGYVEMLLDDQGGPLTGEQRAFCERIQASALRQLTLVGETFEMSRRDARGNVPVRHEELSLRALLAEIEHEIASHPVPAGVTLALRTPAEDVRIVSDPVKLGMIVRNLVQNAIKFTQRGRIGVELRVEDDMLVCTVTDTGVGIPECDRERIFDAFGQVDRAESSGLGLGLYLVRRLAAALAGTVELESRVGEGSRFTVRIPLTLPASERAVQDAGSRP